MFLVKHGFSILDRNYLQKCGEIDIVATKNNIVHFIEVKTVTHETSKKDEIDSYRAEDNVHKNKLQRLIRTIEVYLEEKQIRDNVDWQIDVIIISLNKRGKCIHIEILDNLIVE